MSITSTDFCTHTLDGAAKKTDFADLMEMSEAMEQETTFARYLNNEEPYLPPTTLFDRGIVDYTDEVKTHNKISPHFRNFLFRALIRYMSGDWGDVCEVDRAWNNSLIKVARKQDKSTTTPLTTIGGNKVEAFYEYREEDWSNPAIVYVTTEFSPVPHSPNKTKVSLWDTRLSPEYD